MCHSIRVPSTWLVNGETIEIELPRNLTCAHCEGGGCDICNRAGALSLREREAHPQLLQVSLPAQELGEGAKSLMLRVPEQGGIAAQAGVPRGLLLLKVTPATEPDATVSLVRGEHRELRAPPEVVVRSLVIAIILLVLFVFMLRLSGWL